MVKKVVLALSGGVDSAVCAILLKKKRMDVTGVFLRNWDGLDESGYCSNSEDRRDAEFVCDRVGIPFREVSFVKDYWINVFESVLEEWNKGWNPNPDILCNKRIKFSSFFNYACNELGADAIATGHYARTSFGAYLERCKPYENAKLLRAADGRKDQTYFLSQVSQESLRRTMFPLGDLKKKEVKAIAAENGLERIARKCESTGICFIGSREFSKFIDEYIEPKPGKVINVDTGRIEGEHSGLHMWIRGKKFPVRGKKKPLHVVGSSGSDLLVGEGVFHPALFTNFLRTSQPHWIADVPKLNYYHDCEFKFQAMLPTANCRIVETKCGGLFVCLNTPMGQINVGQYAAFYQRDECLGSAKIVLTGPSLFSLGAKVPEDCERWVRSHVIL